MLKTAPRDAAAVTRSRHTSRERSAPLSRLDAIKEQFLQPRRVHLHGRRARSPRVDCFRRDLLVPGKIRGLENFFDLSKSDIEDGAPLLPVLRPYHSLIAELEAVGREYELAHDREPVSLVPLHRAETRAEAELNEAQIDALANPDDPTALEKLIRAANEYVPTLLRVVRGAEKKIAQSRALEPAR